MPSSTALRQAAATIARQATFKAEALAGVGAGGVLVTAETIDAVGLKNVTEGIDAAVRAVSGA